MPPDLNVLNWEMIMDAVRKWRIRRVIKRIPQALTDMSAGLIGGIIGFVLVVLVVVGAGFIYNRWN
jgi:hypothetical protein